MFGSIGMPELIIIMVVALVVFGPRKLPELGKAIGQTLQEFKKSTRGLVEQVDREIQSEGRPATLGAQERNRKSDVARIAGASANRREATEIESVDTAAMDEFDRAMSAVTFRHAALGLFGSGLALSLAGWVSATPPNTRAATRPEPETPMVTSVEPGGDVLGVGRIAAFAASVAEPRAVRNPFSLAPSGAPAEPDPVQSRARLQRALPSSPIAATDEDVAPALVGVAEQATPRGPVRTAVFMSPDGSVEFVGRGESVGNGRFRVTDISTDVVVIIRSATGVTSRHALQ